MNITWLPTWLGRSRGPDAPIPAATVAPAADAAPRLLLVEDDWPTHSALRRIFTRRGWEVDSAATVAGAVAMLELRPRAMILDLMLPDGVGLDVLRHVRQARIATRVVVTTGTADQRLRAEVEALAPDALISKPVDLDDLLEALGVAPDRGGPQADQPGRPLT